MDPNANHDQLIRLATRMRETVEKNHYIEPNDVLYLAELVLALDGWLSSGGALPTAWVRRWWQS